MPITKRVRVVLEGTMTMADDEYPGGDAWRAAAQQLRTSLDLMIQEGRLNVEYLIEDLDAATESIVDTIRLDVVSCTIGGNRAV